MVLVGDSRVGKTTFFNQAILNKFIETHVSTIGVDFQIKEMTIGHSKVKLQIWDTVGQERYRSLCNSYFRTSDIVVLIFDLTAPVG